MNTSTEPTAPEPSRVFPIGTRVRYNVFTGAIVDPDGPVFGQPQQGYRPPYEAVWLYLDPEFHRGARRGFWVAVSDPALLRARGF